ncbi:MAG TPA: type II secretion system secretin GspD, partial [Gammaproteobacteria bacterium]|nr:type II secretion system secretin GspD [Gammaproteobacteria bacterium]
EGKQRPIPVAGKGPQASGDAMVTRVLRLQHVSAQRMVPILRPLVAQYGHLVAYPDTDALIITDRADNVDRLAGIIKRLDRPTETGEVEVVPLANASAKEMADMLGRLYQKQQGGNQQQPGSGVQVMADPRTNSLILRADVGTRKEIKALAKDLDSPTGSTGNTHVIYLKNADAENLVDVLQSTVESSKTGGKDGGGGTVGEVTIKADAQTNALVVRASKSDFRTIKQVVDKLDVRRLQVYVEALIAEVSTDKAREFGIQWQAAGGLKGSNRGVIGGTSFTVGDSIQGAAQNPLGLGAGLSVGYVDGVLTLPDGTKILNMAGLVRALESANDTNVLSTPNLLTMDNEEAEIVVGQNVPFVTGSYSSTNSGSSVNNPFQTIERKDVGLTLRITPQITEGSAIKMKIYQEVSSVTQQGQAQDIVTNKRSLETTVVAENKRMVVLGGLIQDQTKTNEQQVPLLGRIPLLGALFRYQSVSHSKTNLMIFLRPRIIRGPADMDKPTRSKYQFIDKLRDAQAPQGSGDKPPPLEKWDRIIPGGGDSGEKTGEDAGQ